MAFADEQLGGQELGRRELDAPQAGASHADLTLKRKQWLLGATLCFLAVGAAAGWRWYSQTANAVFTDDAYVGASLADVTPQIEGTILHVLVNDTRHVQRGDLLVTLDPDDANLALEQARAAYDQAVQHVEQSQANIKAAAADVEGREASLKQAQLALDRRAKASGSGAVSAEELSLARTAYDEANSALSVAQQRLASLRATVKSSDVEFNPEVMGARAALDAAMLNLKRTEIRAPVDGVVAQMHAQIGQRIHVGTPLMSIVPIMEAHVDANFKESQVLRLRAGQAVSLTSDLYGSNIVYHGHIEGIGGGTGAALAIIPAQNATGNWIKVVQRLPVRVRLDPSELETHPLRIGLSMNVTVDLNPQHIVQMTPSIRTAAIDAPY
jgi:membrane fusion protein (multidrug efflux system)